MVFNQDLLLEEHSGVATVWLVSTLGNKSNYKKVTKRDIQAVSIPETCNVIKNPPNPLGLRFTSNLLYGVALIYKQKTDYLNNDASSVKTRIQRDLFNKNRMDVVNAAHNSIVNPNVLKNLNQLNNDLHNNNNHGQIFLNDDPLFNINNGLLPSLKELDFLDSEQVDNKINDSNNKELIRQADINNNTVSMISSSGVNSVNKQRIRPAASIDLNPDFLFNEDGLILNDDLTFQLINSNSQNINSDILNDNEGFLELDFGIDPNDFQILNANNDSLNMNNELQNIEAIEHTYEPADKQEVLQNSVKKRKPRKGAISKLPEYHLIQNDSNINLTSDDLRNFRDNYVNEMERFITRKKSLKENNVSLMKDKILNESDHLPNFYEIYGIEPKPRSIPALQNKQGVEHYENEDFIDKLIRNSRASSESIEIRRNSSHSRRNSRSSSTGLNLPLDEGTPIKLNTRNSEDELYNVEFSDPIIEDNRLRRSSSTGSNNFQKFPTVNENEFYDQVDFGYDLNPQELTRDDEEISKVEEISDIDKKSKRQTLKFLYFIQEKMDELGTNKLRFNELFNDMESQMIDKSIVVKSFYEILQLATLSELEIKKEKKVNRLDLLKTHQFEIIL